VPGIRDLTDDQVISQVWLPETRRIEAAGAVRQGKIPSWKNYGGSIDLADLAPLTHAAGFDPYALLNGNKWDQAAEVARVTRVETANEAHRALGQAAFAVHGPAPWRLTFDSWSNELRDLEFAMTEPAGLTSTQAARLAELAPAGIDEAGLSYEVLYARLVETARLAGEDVADWSLADAQGFTRPR
jgi:hypothetical protein